MNTIKTYRIKTVNGIVTKITEVKIPKRDSFGRFTSDFTIRLRLKRRAIKETCAYAEVCPFNTASL